MKITEKRLRKVIRKSLKESWNKYGQPVQTGFQGSRHTNYAPRDRNVPNETTADYVRAFKGWANNNLKKDTYNLMGSGDSFQIFLPPKSESLSIKFSEERGLEVYFSDWNRNKIIIDSVDDLLEILESEIWNASNTEKDQINQIKHRQKPGNRKLPIRESNLSSRSFSPELDNMTKRQIYWKLEDALRKIGDTGSVRMEEFDHNGVLDVHVRTDTNGEIGDTKAKKEHYKKYIENALYSFLNKVSVKVFAGEKMWWTFEIKQIK